MSLSQQGGPRCQQTFGKVYDVASNQQIHGASKFDGVSEIAMSMASTKSLQVCSISKSPGRSAAFTNSGRLASNGDNRSKDLRCRQAIGRSVAIVVSRQTDSRRQRTSMRKGHGVGLSFFRPLIHSGYSRYFLLRIE